MIRIFGTNILAGKAFLFVADIALMVAASVLAVVLRLGVHDAVGYLSGHLPSFIIQILIYTTCFFVGDMYDLKRDVRKAETLLSILAVCAVSMALSILVFYTRLTYVGRGIFLIFGGLVFIFTVMLRLFQAGDRSSKAWEKRVLIIGAGSSGESLGNAVIQHENCGLRVLGYVDDDPDKQGMSICGSKVVGNSGDLARLVGELEIDMLVVSISHEMSEELIKTLLNCHYKDVNVTDMFSVYESITGKLPLSQMNSKWLLLAAMSKQRLLYGKVKRLMDISFSLVILLITLPLSAVAALAILIETGGPVLYFQERLGQDYRKFRILKFSSMMRDAEKESGAVWTAESDARVTRVGRVLRKLRVDELPQLFNVLRGDMSFIGPRPEREVFVKALEKELPAYSHRLVVKPGLTGWAQVMHGYAASIEESTEKLRYDLYYVKNMSLMLDMLILLRTVKVVLMFRGR